MKKLSVFDKAVLCLTAAFLLFSAGYFTAENRPSGAWRVETQRQDGSGQETSAVREEDGGRPESLLEGEVINLNTASQGDLERLPGIGESRARAIVEYRQEHGPFRSVDELLLVRGIGEGILEGLREYVTV